MVLIMKRPLYTYEQVPVARQAAQRLFDMLSDTICMIRNGAYDAHYTTPYAALFCPFDDSALEQINHWLTNIGKVEHLVVIGIGGSLQGFRAVYELLYGEDYVQKTSRCTVTLLDSIDPRTVEKQLCHIYTTITAGKKLHICIISKSGTTTETIALWSVVADIVHTAFPAHWHQLVTIITDPQTPLATYADEHNIRLLYIPKQISGRYSVLSVAGLALLAVCGVDIKMLCAGARQAIMNMLDMTSMESPAIRRAITVAAYYAAGMNIHDFFMFGDQFTSFGFWYRQLYAESLGKKQIHGGKPTGILPTVSIGPRDLHSMVQLYLGGPACAITSFFILNAHVPIKTSKNPAYDALVPNVTDHSLANIMQVLQQSIMIAYQKQQRSFMSITLPAASADVLGALLQNCMLEVICLGALLDVNPFDQPDIEVYKSATKMLLRRL
jgi:glucose-6-phosphate isomerase